MRRRFIAAGIAWTWLLLELQSPARQAVATVLEPSSGARTTGALKEGGGSPHFRIAYEDDRAGSLDIWVMADDGSGKRRLTMSPSDETTPAWSPDGRRIAFASNVDGTADIYVMSRDGSGLKRLTAGADTDLFPAWSPDGRRLAFARTDLACPGANPATIVCTRIYVMNADGTRLKALTPGASAAWSPDGRRLAVGCYLGAFVGPFEFTDCGERGIFLIRADGSGRSRLADGFGPAWSPDGHWLAYASGQEGQSVQIQVMNLKTREKIRLTEEANGVLDRYPCWSPDSKKIAFYSKDQPTTYREIHSVGVDGSNRQRLGDGSGPSCSPASSS